MKIVLDKVKKKGGEVLVPKTLHADESGYFAMFIDSEGNRLRLHSPNWLDYIFSSLKKL